MGESMLAMFVSLAYLTPDSDVGVAEMPVMPVAVGAQDLLGELDRPAH
jgi:hypothetical protein